ncbi:hypothetical protein RI049_20875 [Cedecea neteri]|uniref:hypothetical protein n=1 Tax=Cedecea neteri TaxID=158822 RepID=UPI0005D9A17E|nr:hypothetical protein [Cedecea neteri]AJZ88054.1 hypothetical protein VW41_02830 [Klebsiella michiganensis]WPU22459.1 hypothetical protein RI049_20875 [Cedecea neteri]
MDKKTIGKTLVGAIVFAIAAKFSAGYFTKSEAPIHRDNVMLDEVNTNTKGYQKQIDDMNNVLTKIQRETFTAGQRTRCDIDFPEYADAKARTFFESVGVNKKDMMPGTELHKQIVIIRNMNTLNCYLGASDKARGSYSEDIKEKKSVYADAKNKATTARERGGVMGMGLMLDAYDAGFNAN